MNTVIAAPRSVSQRVRFLRRTASALALLSGFCGMSTSASAAPSIWSLAASAQNLDSYLDVSALSANGARISARFLLDFGQQLLHSNGKPFRSAVSIESIDCRHRRMDLRATYYYANAMGEGELVESAVYPAGEPRAFPAGSVAESMIDAACRAFRLQSGMEQAHSNRTPREANAGAVQLGHNRALPREIAAH